MDEGQRATLGLALIAVGYSGFVYFVLQMPFTLFTIGPPGVAIGLWVATAGLAALRTGKGYALLATGFVLCSVFAIVLLLADLGATDLFKVPHALAALGFTQAARLHRGPGGDTEGLRAPLPRERPRERIG